MREKELSLRDIIDGHSGKLAIQDPHEVAVALVTCRRWRKFQFHRHCTI